ncbi:MAG: DUF6691 family protein [Myxococcota bacterium]
MNDLLPLAPQVGLATHWYLLLVLAIGLLFGFALEKAGFGSARNLTAIFVLRDFRVFRVMFSAVLTAMVGIHLLHFVGLVNLSLLPITPTFFWSILAGGVVFGVGFYLGGFCPGTAMVALARGRLDGLAFIFGMILGIWGFAEIYDLIGQASWFRDFYAPAGAAPATLYGDGPVWPWVVGITAAALAGFWVTPIVERRFGLRTAGELREGRSARRQGSKGNEGGGFRWRRLAPVGLGFFVTALIVAELTMPEPDLEMDRPREAAVLATEEDDLRLPARTLAGWLIEEARRREQGASMGLVVMDLRSDEARARLPIPSAHSLDEHASESSATARVLRELRRLEAPPRATVVLVAEESTHAVEVVSKLRRRHLPAYLLRGGAGAWEREVLGWEPEAPSFSEETRKAFEEQWRGALAWFRGEQTGRPPSFVFPGEAPPLTEVSTVEATGSGAGGGCN